MNADELAAIRARADQDRPDHHDPLFPLYADRHALLAEVDQLHSWDGLMSLLNEHWPEDIFVTAPDPEDYHEPLYRRDDGTAYVRADPGVIITGLIRWVDRLTRESANLRHEIDFQTASGAEEVAALRQQMGELRYEHQREMREAGKDLAAAARDLEYAERRLDERGPVW